MIGEFLKLSTLIMGLATKVPQIYAIIKAGNADGIAASGVAMEIWGFTTFIMYTVGKNFPLWVYFDAAIMIAQNTLLLFLILHHQRSLNTKSVGIYFLCALFQAGVGLKYVPVLLTTIIMNGNLLLMVFAMTSQLRLIHRNKDAGSLSLVTLLMVIYIMSARLPFIYESGDLNLIIGMTMAYLFNIAIAFSVWYYNKPKLEKSKDN